MPTDPAAAVDPALAMSFDSVPDLYERARLGYAPQLFAEIIRYSGVTPESRVLEIGPGTGKATRAFAEAGCTIDCVEPGKNLASLLASTFSGRPRVAVHTTRFEDFSLRPGSYDLVVAATSLHWVDPAIRFTKTREALVPGGTLAVFCHLFPDPKNDLWNAIHEAHDRLAGGMREAA